MKTSDPGSLQNLHDIILPQPIPWLPPAPGWYALGLSLLLLLCWFSVQKYLAWKHNAYRREALAELETLRKQLLDSTGFQQLLPQLPPLVKRTAIAAYGRSLVASLSGDDWLNFLDKTGATRLFTKGSGRLLSDCSYLSGSGLLKFSSEQAEGLQEAVSYWIRKHKSPYQE